MTARTLNPFRYGKPVPPERFVGREDALRTVFARLNNGESTAVVGEPHIGKTSFLRYIRDERVRAAWLGEAAEHYAFIDIDCHLLPSSYAPDHFWSEALERVEETFADPLIRRQIEVVRQSAYGSFSLKRLFDLLGRGAMRAMLMVDEFDVLLHHSNFNTAEFFGALRSFAVQTDGLALVTFSRLPVAEMNRRSHEINPLGSPFFNNLIEVRLLPLHPNEIDQLIDQALEGSGVSFTPGERAYIARSSGRHPFLVQIVCAALFEVATQSQSGAKRRAAAERMVQRWAGDHFGDVWRHLNTDARRGLLLLAFAELPSPPTADSPGQIDQHDAALRWLANGGLIEPTNDKRCAVWSGERWRVSAASFAHWMIDNRKWEDVEGRATVSQPDEVERAERVDFLRKKITETRRRLNQRELQHAQLGVNTDPAIVNEIEAMKRTIADDERELRRLGASYFIRPD